MITTIPYQTVTFDPKEEEHLIVRREENAYRHRTRVEIELYLHGSNTAFPENLYRAMISHAFVPATLYTPGMQYTVDLFSLSFIGRRNGHSSLLQAFVGASERLPSTSLCRYLEIDLEW